MQQPRHGLMVSWLVFLLIFALAGLMAGCGGGSDLSFTTEYQAVFLDNGQVLFGKLGDVGTDYLSLRDVYYIQRQVEPEKKEARNLLVRLGSEWHAPDFMRINARHIVFIEPVAPDSRVANSSGRPKRTPPAPRRPRRAPPARTPAPAVAPPTQTPPPATAPKPEKRRPAGR